MDHIWLLTMCVCKQHEISFLRLITLQDTGNPWLRIVDAKLIVLLFSVHGLDNRLY